MDERDCWGTAWPLALVEAGNAAETQTVVNVSAVSAWMRPPCSGTRMRPSAYCRRAVESTLAARRASSRTAPVEGSRR